VYNAVASFMENLLLLRMYRLRMKMMPDYICELLMYRSPGAPPCAQILCAEIHRHSDIGERFS